MFNSNKLSYIAAERLTQIFYQHKIIIVKLIYFSMDLIKIGLKIVEIITGILTYTGLIGILVLDPAEIVFSSGYHLHITLIGTFCILS